jgi:transposase InsO family protein
MHQAVFPMEKDNMMRDFKSPGTAGVMAEGFRTYYNFIMPHQALNGLTPAQVASIDLNIEQNKWLSLLEKSV